MTKTLYLSDIQHFSVGDGPGIRTTVFFKGCNLSCPWCHNPEARTQDRVVLEYSAANRRVVSGKLYSPEEAAAEVLADIDFYVTDGGGLTVSGGECMLYPAEIVALARAVKEGAEKCGKPLTVAIDTAGCVPYTSFQTVNPFADLYLFDLKTASAEKYASIGGNVRLVVQNILALLRDGKKVRLRLPLIPGFNTDTDSLQALAKEIETIVLADSSVCLDLLPFHRLATGKYRAMGLEYPYAETPPLPAEKIEEVRAYFSSFGWKVHIEG